MSPRRTVTPRVRTIKHKNINRFYVGADHIARAVVRGLNDPHTRGTIEEAIEHAQQMMEKEDKDSIVIVQIVRIVRRAQPPIIVEKV